MDILLPAMMQVWSLLLKSPAPLILSIVSLSVSIYLMITPRLHLDRLRTRCSYLLAGQNLLASLTWGLIYAESVLHWRNPISDYGAPLLSLLCLLFLPLDGWWLFPRLKRIALNRMEKLAFGFSLGFLLLSIYPGIYLITVLVVAMSDPG